jgi:phosphoglycerol geranylgeranyltransferase
MLLNRFYQAQANKQRLLAVLIDPAAVDDNLLGQYINQIKKTPPDFIFVGGSLVWQNINPLIKELKEKTNVPVLIFPGSITQISNYADGVLFISLISGRNPEFLIGQHVLAAPMLKNSKLEIIPTGYILIENGKTTSVEYISNTKPIPKDKIDIIKATALAGQYIGHKLIYLEAGSGAATPPNYNIIKEVYSYIDIPIIVGGGITSPEIAEKMYESGATCVVVGNLFEKKPQYLEEFTKILKK